MMKFYVSKQIGLIVTGAQVIAVLHVCRVALMYEVIVTSSRMGNCNFLTGLQYGI